jgi:hypothetical protein
MARLWEIRGLFGNEFAMEKAIDELKKHKGFDWIVLDRRNLSVRMKERNKVKEDLVRRTLEMCHGYVESEAPLGVYDSQKESEKRKKIRQDEKNRKK